MKNKKPHDNYLAIKYSVFTVAPFILAIKIHWIFLFLLIGTVYDFIKDKKKYNI